MTSQLARDLAAIAHAHYVTPSTTDQGPSEALVERMRERLKGVEVMLADAKLPKVEHIQDIYRLSKLREALERIDVFLNDIPEHCGPIGVASDMQHIAHEALSELRKAVET